jgi:hypothetical protein
MLISRTPMETVRSEGPDTPRKPDPRRSKPPAEPDPTPDEGEEEGAPEDPD